LVTFSAGNYGKAFSFLCSKLNRKGKVLLPETAPESRIHYIQSQSVETEKFPPHLLLDAVESHVKQGWKLVHPLDDLYLIAGYAP
jgi:threonine dehydratase